MKLNLPDAVSSPQDVTSLLLELREYTQWYAHESIKKRLHAKHPSEGPVISPATSELLRTWSSKKPLSRESLESLIKTVEDFKKSAPTVTVTLAAPPTNDVKKTVVSWFRQNLSPEILVNFTFNSTLLGGMVVRSGSRVFDWSFRRQLLAARDKFPEVLRRV